MNQQKIIKAQYCTGHVCGAMGFCVEVSEALQKYFSPNQIQPAECMGLCDSGGAFAIDGKSYAGEDLDRLSSIVSAVQNENRVVSPLKVSP